MICLLTAVHTLLVGALHCIAYTDLGRQKLTAGTLAYMLHLLAAAAPVAAAACVLLCRFIHSYSKSPAQTIGSVLCTNVATGSRHETVEVCTIHMSDMPDDVIDKLIEEGDVMWCAGGLMVEHPLVVPYITQIDGTQESVMGLGKEAVMSVLVAAAGL
jgi:hypothetical protein